MKKNWFYKLLIVLLPLIGGGIIALFLNFDFYTTLTKPPLAPPRILFPIAWSILYLLMGITFLAIKEKKDATLQNLFLIQLFVNYLWPIVFFLLESLLGAFVIIVLLDVLVLIWIIDLSRKERLQAYLQIPYFLWLLFATYLNFSLLLLN